MQPELFFAIDGGGTKCEALLVEVQSGKLLAQHRVAGTELPECRSVEGGLGRSAAVLARLIDKFPPELMQKPLFLSRNWMQDFDPAFFPIRPLQSFTFSESESLRTLGNLKWGIAAIAGTGTNVYFYQPDGKKLLMDALGPALGDRGGACWIGWKLLQAAARDAQLTDYTGPIWSAVMTYLGFDPNAPKAMGQLIQFSLSDPDRSRIGDLFRLTAELADRGEPAARNILLAAAGELLATVSDGVEKLNWQRKAAELVAGGGVFRHSPLVWEEFCRQLQRRYPAITPKLPQLPQAAGQIFGLYRQLLPPGEADKRIAVFSSQFQ